MGIGASEALHAVRFLFQLDILSLTNEFTLALRVAPGARSGHGFASVTISKFL